MYNVNFSCKKIMKKMKRKNRINKNNQNNQNKQEQKNLYHKKLYKKATHDNSIKERNKKTKCIFELKQYTIF